MKNVGASYIIDLCTISTSTARTHFSKKNVQWLALVSLEFSAK